MSLPWRTQMPMSFAVKGNVACEAAVESIGRFMARVFVSARDSRGLRELELDRITLWKAKGHPEGV
jgi:hypothetical protein